jgi:4-hydroxybenzoate polyprenyltransferase
VIVPYLRLMRLDKPVGIWLLLWPCLWALFLAAKGIPKPSLLLVFILGVVVTRSAGCVINDMADRKIDGHVERSKDRPLVSGEVSMRGAFLLLLILGMMGVALLMTLNRLTCLLALVAVLLLLVYPFSKRFIKAPQCVLGLAFAWSVPMAFAAQRGYVPLASWWLFAAACLWPVAYDTIYAMVDVEDDRHLNIYSTALLWGEHVCLAIAIIEFVVCALLLVVAFVFQLAWPYFFFLFIAALFLIYQHGLIITRERVACFKAFLQSHYFALFVFLGIFLSQPNQGLIS